MRISKSTESKIRKEFSKLKKRISQQDKKNNLFVKQHCKILLHVLQKRWDYPLYQIFDDVRVASIESIIHDLRND